MQIRNNPISAPIRPAARPGTCVRAAESGGPGDEVAAKWEALANNPIQHPATLKGISADGTWHLEGVRWGYRETGPDRTTWEPIFKDCRVNPKDVKDVYICIEPFPPEWIAGHGEAVIEFNHPITNSDGESDNRMVFSVEAWTAPGESYGLWKGMGKNFGIIHQLGSFSDRVQRQARKEGRPMLLYKVDLTPEQKLEFAQNALQSAVENRTGEYYHTLTNSCFSSQVVALNDVLPEDQQINRWTQLLHMPRLSATIPSTAGLVLERYGLRTADKPIEITPDSVLHPRPEKDPGPIARASQKPWWGTACRLSGAALTGALVGRFAGLPGAILGGLAGSWIGGVMGDQTRILNSSVKTSPNAFYPDFVKADLGVAQEAPRFLTA